MDIPSILNRSRVTELGTRPTVVLSALIPGAGIILSEMSVYAGFTDVALGGYVIVLFLATLIPLRLTDDVPVFQAFVLIPVFRLVNLGMPVFVDVTLVWLVMVYGPLIPAAYVVARSNPQVTISGGWKVGIGSLPIAILGGIVLGQIEYATIQPAALIPEWNLEWLIVLVFGMIGIVAVVEELLFRVILQPVLVDRLGVIRGIVLTGIVFAAMHSVFSSPIALGFAFAFGVLLGVLYHHTKSLILLLTIHGTANLFVFGVMPVQGSMVPLQPVIESLSSFT